MTDIDPKSDIELHAVDEHVIVATMAERAALLAELIDDLRR